MNYNSETTRIENLILLYELSQIAKYRGLLVLEDYYDSITVPIIRTGIEMIVEGNDPSIVREYLDSAVENEIDDCEKQTLRIFCDAMMDIQSGNSHNYLLQHNAHLFDEEEKKSLWNHLIGFEKQKREYYKTITEHGADSELSSRADDILSLDYIYRTNLITCGLEWNILADALPGCSRDIQIRILDAMPDLEVRQILEQHKISFPDDSAIFSGLQAVVDYYEMMFPDNRII